jgi:putative hydrolase
VINLKRVDYHLHSTFSDGEGSYKQIIDRAKKLGLYGIAITDHFDAYDENKRTSSITEEELFNHFDNIRYYGQKIGQRVLCGIETCTDFDGNLRLSEEVIKNADIIITSPHYVEYDGKLIQGKFYDKDYWERYKEKVINMARGKGDILGHCEGYLPHEKLLIPNTTTFEQRQQLSMKIADRFFDNQYIERFIGALKESGKAVELHCITHTPREWVIEKLFEAKIPVSIGSDSHTLSQVGDIDWAINILNKYNAGYLQFIK